MRCPVKPVVEAGMKLLVVGHTYLTAFAQRKYVEMKRLNPDIDLRILTPRSVSHVFKHYDRESSPEFSRSEMVDIRNFFGRSHMSYVLDPVHFSRLLLEFRPERIHIEEDPYSAVGVEAVFLARLFCPSAKISFFILDNLGRSPGFPLNIIKRILNRYSLSRAELVVCGNCEAERLLREKKGYKGRTAVLPQHGLDPEPYLSISTRPIRNELNIPVDVPLIGFFGRLVPEKGVTLLLEALKRCKRYEWSVLIVGSGPQESEISGKWKEEFGGRLFYCKAVPHVDVPAYIRALDFLVLPSYSTTTWKEQFGLVLAMAMMAGIPCVGSSSGAIPEVMGPGGLVFAEKDVNELARVLGVLLEDKALCAGLAARAKEFAADNYTHQVVSSRYLEQFGYPGSESC